MPRNSHGVAYSCSGVASSATPKGEMASSGREATDRLGPASDPRADETGESVDDQRA